MRYKISDIAKIISGGTPKKKVLEYWNGHIPWITIKDFKRKYVTTCTDYISQEGLKHSSATLTNKDDILISARGTVGKILLANGNEAFNQSIYGIRVNTKFVFPQYLYYWLLKNIELIKQGVHGSVFDTITRKTFDLIEIELPSLTEQKKIIQKIECFDLKIILNNQVNDNLVA